MSTSSSNRGGARAGAGRPSAPSQRIRIPECHVEAVQSYLEAAREPTLAQNPRPVSLNPSTVGLIAFTSQVPAGFPSPAQDYVEDVLDLNRHLIERGHEPSTFVVRVKGWSMIGAGIFDGDEVIVDRAIEPRQGDVVVAIVNGDLTIKRLGMVGADLALLPENAHFKPIVFKDEDCATFEVWGVVTRCLRNLRR